MTKFKYPNSDKTVGVGWTNGLWMFLFGCIYLVYKGLWRHILVLFAINLIIVFSADNLEAGSSYNMDYEPRVRVSDSRNPEKPLQGKRLRGD